MTARDQEVAHRILCALSLPADPKAVATVEEIVAHERKISLEVGFAIAQANVTLFTSGVSWGDARSALRREIGDAAGDPGEVDL